VGSIHEVSDLTFPPDTPLEIRVLRDVEVRNGRLWLDVGDPGLIRLRRSLTKDCQLVDVELEALRIEALFDNRIRSLSERDPA
jgi:hypothetical protein